MLVYSVLEEGSVCVRTHTWVCVSLLCQCCQLYVPVKQTTQNMVPLNHPHFISSHGSVG